MPTHRDKAPPHHCGPQAGVSPNAARQESNETTETVFESRLFNAMYATSTTRSEWCALRYAARRWCETFAGRAASSLCLPAVSCRAGCCMMQEQLFLSVRYVCRWCWCCDEVLTSR